MLISGEAASAFGTSASIIALPVVAMHAFGDVRQAGLADTALSAGILLACLPACLPAGVFAGRYDRRTLLLYGNLLGATSLGTLAVLQTRSALGLPVLTSAALLLGMAGSTLTPTENVAVRNLVHPDRRGSSPSMQAPISSLLSVRRPCCRGREPSAQDSPR
ncbi:MFS transporter [Streptomyces sp. NPDC007100]|uniref:MFS transporter n=1 Tax=Streptomyces sp. NPDC007100 TaxID=3155602 RepID=UPI0033E345EA